MQIRRKVVLNQRLLMTPEADALDKLEYQYDQRGPKAGERQIIRRGESDVRRRDAFVNREGKSASEGE